MMQAIRKASIGQETHFAILGGGLVGRLLAWRLLEAGKQATLFDKDISGNESAGVVAAAMIAPVSESLDADPVIYTQGKASLSIWASWIQSLHKTQPFPIHFASTGSIFVSHENDRPLYNHLMKKLQRSAIFSGNDFEHITGQSLQLLEPELANQFDKGCLLKPEGYLDNHALFQALNHRIQALGGQWVESVLPPQLSDIRKQLTRSKYDHIIDCRGMGAHSELSDLRGVRGEILRVHAPEVNLSRPIRLMHPRYKLYVVPRPDNQYVIGATEIESHSESAVTLRSSLELLSALYSLHPGFAESRIISQQAKCRPAFIHNLPRIEQRGHDIFINGLYRHGYLLSPCVINQAMYTLGLAAEPTWPELNIIDQI